MYKSISAASVSILILVALSFSCERIDAGHTGILFNHYGVTDEKGVSDRSIVSGTVWYNPATMSVFEYPHHWQTAVYNEVTFNSKEGEEVLANIAVIVRMKKESIPNIFDSYRESANSLLNGFIEQKVIDALNVTAGLFQAVDIAGTSKGIILSKALDSLNDELNPQGFEFQQVSFASRLIFSENVQNSIQGVINAQEEAKKAQAEVLRQEAEAQKAIIDAKADSLADVTRAAGEAAANRMIQASLTPSLIEYRQLEKWNGSVPQVVSGGNGMILSLDSN